MGPSGPPPGEPVHAARDGRDFAVRRGSGRPPGAPRPWHGAGRIAATVLLLTLAALLPPSPAAAQEMPALPTRSGAADGAGPAAALSGVAVLAVAALGVVAAALLRARSDRRRMRQLEGALDLLEHGFALYDADDRLVFCNRAYREIYPRSAPRMVPGASFAELIRYGVAQGEYVEARDDPEGWIARRLALHEAADGRPMLQPLGDGRILRVSEHRTADGGRVGLRVDVTGLERSRRQLAESEARFRALAEHAPIGIWQLDAHGRTVYGNPALRRMLGCDPGDRPAELLLPAEGARLVRDLLGRGGDAASREFELVLTVAGELRCLAGIATPLAPAAGGGLLLTLLDVSIQRRALAELEHLALHDPLTGLGNRRLFEREADLRLQRGEPFALVLVDIDDLSTFNARFGHGEGDRLLVAVAGRLRRFTRVGDLAFRLGGDEFALLVPGIADPGTLAACLGRLAAILAAPPGADGDGEGPVAAWSGSRIAGAVAPLHARTRERLLANAELALALARQPGRGRTAVYEPGLAEARRRRLDLLQRLERAIAEDGLELVAQPQIGLADGRPGGAEVLLRWFDPIEKEPVPPAEFVRLAEESGLVLRLDAWVLERVCAWLAGLGLPADRLPRLAVNVSAAHVVRPELPQLVSGLLATHGLPPDRLEIEVTEHVVLADRERGRRFLGELHGLGVGLALDDFGTGYSSLAYLADLPFDRLKIDRSFVAGVEADRHRRTIVRAITGLARGLGMEVVAEGVETAAQRDILLAEGCDLAQGHLIARPMPLDRLGEWLRTWDAGAWRREVEAARLRGIGTARGEAASGAPAAGAGENGTGNRAAAARRTPGSPFPPVRGRKRVRPDREKRP